MDDVFKEIYFFNKMLKKNQNYHDFYIILSIFENPNPNPGTRVFLKSKPETHFFKSRPRFEITMHYPKDNNSIRLLKYDSLLYNAQD